MTLLQPLELFDVEGMLIRSWGSGLHSHLAYGQGDVPLQKAYTTQP